MILPGPRLLALLLLAAVPLAGLDRAPVLAGVTAVWLLSVGVAALADLRATPPASAWELERRHEDRLSLAAWNPVEVRVRLRRGARPLRLWLRDTPPPTFGIAEAERLLRGRVWPRQAESFRYTVRPPRRGRFAFGDLYLRWQSPWGLLWRQARFPAAAAVQVYPNLVDIKKYDLLLRRHRLWELGLRRTRLRGSGNEFERLRDYLPDDEYRRINWKATARRGKPISVEYETERSQNVVALLDVGRMMRSPVGDVAKMDFAINAVLLLAWVAVQKGDRIGLLTFADGVETWLAPRGGKAQFQRMLELLFAVEGSPVEPDYDPAFGYLAGRQPKRSLVLVLTDFAGRQATEALVRQMVRLRRHHLPLLVTMSDPSVVRLASQPVRDSTSLYERTVAEGLLEERRLTLDRLQRAGVLTLDGPADRLSVALIDRYLELKARTMI
jgi:uncharacterized protein (DUF58 family)